MALRPVQKDFPLEAAGALASIVRAGTERTNAAKLAQACDDVISWASFEAFGDPDAPPKLTSLAPSPEPSGLTDEQVIEWLDEGGRYTPDGRLAASLIPARCVLKFALKVLLALL